MVIEALLVVNTIGIGLALFKLYKPKELVEIPHETVTVDSDTEGLV